MRNHRIPSRPHLQGDAAPLRLRHSARKLTDGAGLVLLRRLWDRLRLGSWLDERTTEIPGHYRPSLMVELWIALLCYGGGWMDDLKLVAARGVRRLFGWEAVPDPTTFGRWLRRAGPTLVPLLDDLLWRLLEARWAEDGVPEAVTVALDSTVSVRYGNQQAGVEEITVRLDKGFFAERIVRCLQQLEVSYLLKIPNHVMVRRALWPWRRSSRAEGIFEEAETVWTSSATLWGGRLLSVQGRRPQAEADDTLGLDTYEVTDTAHVLIDREGIHALTAWRAYNRGAAGRGPHQGARPALGGPDRRRRPRWECPPLAAGHPRLPDAARDPLPGPVGRLAVRHPGSAAELALPPARPVHPSRPEVLPPAPG